MQTLDSSYLNVFKRNESESLQEIVDKRFTVTQKQALIRDILKDDEEKLLPIKPFFIRHAEDRQGMFERSLAIKRGKSLPLNSRFANIPLSSLSFQFLAHQHRDWLNQFSPFLENCFLSFLQEKDDTALSRLRSLIAFTRAGLNRGFLNYILKEPGLDPITEVELYLLIAKLEEASDELNPEAWSEKIDIIEKPHLVVFLIYIYREKNPIKGIRLLLPLDMNIEEESDGYSLPPTIQNYIPPYLRQAIFNYFAGKEKEEERLACANLQEVRRLLRSTWIRELFEEAINHPALTKMLEPCMYVVNEEEASELQKEKHEKELTAIIDQNMSKDE